MLVLSPVFPGSGLASFICVTGHFHLAIGVSRVKKIGCDNDVLGPQQRRRFGRFSSWQCLAGRDPDLKVTSASTNDGEKGEEQRRCSSPFSYVA